MREIVERLTENRQIELAKSILESNGYKVSKKSKRLKESAESEFNIYDHIDEMYPFDEFADEYREYDEFQELESKLGIPLEDYMMVTTESEGRESEIAHELSKIVDKSKRLELLGETSPGGGMAIYKAPTGEKFAREWSMGIENFYIPKNPIR